MRNTSDSAPGVFRRDAPSCCRAFVCHAASRSSAKGLRKALAAHAAEAADLNSQLNSSLQELANVVADAEASDDFLAAMNAIDGLKLDRTLVIQKTVRLWATAVDLAKRRLEELKPQVQPAIDAHEKIFADVKEQLTAMGSGLEAMAAYRDNGHAAERQFAFFVRQNTRVAKAYSAAHDARAHVAAAQEAIFARLRGLEAAKAALRAEAFRHAQQ